MLSDHKFLALCKAQIAVQGLQKKKVARSCGLYKARFSELLQGERELTPELREKLTKILDLEKPLQQLSAARED